MSFSKCNKITIFLYIPLIWYNFVEKLKNLRIMIKRARLFVYPAFKNFSKRPLSNKIKEVLNIQLNPSSSIDAKPIQLASVSKNINAYNLDLFASNLGNQEDRSSEILDLLAKLRSTKLANTCLDSTHFAVVGHLLQNLTIQDVVPVLLDRPKYGIFLNNFTGFAVTEILHEEKEYVLGLPLALKLVLSEEVDSAFIKGFCLKASFETLKKGHLDDHPVEETHKGKVQEKKIRVKFLRNVNPPNIHYEIGKAFLKIEHKILEGNMKTNAKILGFVLTENFSELDKALSMNSIEVCEDITDISKKFLLGKNQDDLANKICNFRSQISFEVFLDKFLKEISEKETALLVEEQKQLFAVWQTLRNQIKLEVEKEKANKERQENIEVIANDIATKKELLWFFDNEEKIELEIFKKRVSYPKRWFGKKKKPRVIDENYIPPQIRKIN